MATVSFRNSNTPVYSQLTTGAQNAAISAFSLRSLISTSTKVALVSQVTSLPNAPNFTSGGTQSGTQYSQTLTGSPSILSGAYVADCSSWASADVNSPSVWKVFDGTTTTWWENNYSVQAGYGTGGTYTGSYSTTVSGSSIGGEWIQLKFPTAVTLRSYSMYSRGTATQSTQRMPQQWRIAGSNDGTTWTTVDSQTGITAWTSQATLSFIPSVQTSAWTYFRLIAQTLVAGPNDINMGQWTLTVSETSFSTDFYANTVGNLTNGTGQSLSTWLGAATPYVITLYDQTTAGQHLFSSGNPVINQTTTPMSIQFTGTEYFQNTIPYTFNFGSGSFTLRYVVSNNTGGLILYKASNNSWGWLGHEKKFWLGDATTTETSRGGYPEQVGNAEDYIWSGTAITTSKTSVVHKATSTSAIPIYINGTSQTLARNTLTMAADPGNWLYIGRGSNASNYIGNIFELQVFNTALSDADRLALESTSSVVQPIRFYTTNLKGSFSQLSTSAQNSVTGVFGLKALFSSPARVLNLRRSTDNVTADFYADTQGNLTTGSGQTFASWIGAATAYVTTWYDQTSAARHATQATTANQPTFDGTTVNFTTAANQYLSTPASCFTDLSSFTVTCRHTTVGNSGDQGIWGIGNSFSFASNNLIRPGGGAGYRNYFLGLDFNVGTYAVGNIVTLKYAQSTGTGVSPSNGTRTLYVNQTSAGTNATTGWTGNGPGGGFIGHGSFAGAMDGGLYYIFMFNTALSDADRSIVENQTVAPIGPSIPINFFTTPYYPFTTFTFTPAGATGISGPTSLASYGTSYPGYGTSYALTLSGGTQLWKVPISGSYTITVAGAAGGSVLTTPTPGNGAILTLTTSLVQGHVIKIMVGQKGTDGNNATPIGGGGGGGTFVYNNTTSILIAAAGGGGGAGVISGGTYVSTMNGKNAQLANSGLSGYSNPSGQWTGGAGGTAGSGGGAGSNLYGGAGGGYSGDGVGGALAFLNGGTGVGKGGFGGGANEGLQAGGGGGGYSGGGGGGGNKDNLGAGGGGGGGSYDITGAYSGTLTNTGTGYVTITKV
jgi:hypothetical protein